MSMGKPAPEKKMRNQKIYEMRKQGMTFEKIAKHFNLTRTRVHQIYNKLNVKQKKS